MPPRPSRLATLGGEQFPGGMAATMHALNASTQTAFKHILCQRVLRQRKHQQPRSWHESGTNLARIWLGTSLHE